jgi:hypothetical protein
MPASESAPSLRDLQQGLAALLAPWPTDGGPDVARWLAPPPLGTLAHRLAAYRDGYPARVREALADVYPALEHLLGAGHFAALAERYLVAVRPATRNLNHAGRALPGYLDGDELTRPLPFLPDLARLEWAVACAFHAREVRPLDARAIAAIPAEAWERVQLRFQPAVAVITSTWPVLDLLRAVDVPREEIDLPVTGRPQHVLVLRRDLEVRCETIAPPQARALTALMAGTPLGTVTAELDTAGVDAATVRSWFHGWMETGAVSGYALLGSTRAEH